MVFFVSICHAVVSRTSGAVPQAFFSNGPANQSQTGPSYDAPVLSTGAHWHRLGNGICPCTVTFDWAVTVVVAPGHYDSRRRRWRVSGDPGARGVCRVTFRFLWQRFCRWSDDHHDHLTTNLRYSGCSSYLPVTVKTILVADSDLASLQPQPELWSWTPSQAQARWPQAIQFNPISSWLGFWAMLFEQTLEKDTLARETLDHAWCDSRQIPF